ncbi:MAG: hypothetical protein KKA73_18765 [Chloroflexi bacterium]|nr:hypothetical protein [Chloroflexota bacterium]MBU1749731.1 hypothetical protein [Chloroflexota bacterium]
MDATLAALLGGAALARSMIEQSVSPKEESEMTAITRSLLSASTLLLEWETLGSCQSEDQLRTVFMGAFLHAREAHLSYILLREEDAKRSNIAVSTILGAFHSAGESA